MMFERRQRAVLIVDVILTSFFEIDFQELFKVDLKFILIE